MKNRSSKKKHKSNSEILLAKHYDKNTLFGILILVLSCIIGLILVYKFKKTYLMPIVIIFSISAGWVFSLMYYNNFKKSIKKKGLYNRLFIEKAIELKLESPLKNRIKYYLIFTLFIALMGYTSWTYYYEDTLLQGGLEYTTGKIIGTYTYQYTANGKTLTDKVKSSDLKYSTYFKIAIGDEYEVAYSLEDNGISKINFEKPSNKQLLQYQKIATDRLDDNQKNIFICSLDILYKEFGLKGIAALFYMYDFDNYLNDYLIDELDEISSNKRFEEVGINCKEKTYNK